MYGGYYAGGTRGPGAGDGGRGTGVMQQLDILVRDWWWRGRRRYVYSDGHQDLRGELFIQPRQHDGDFRDDGDLAKRGRRQPHGDIQPVQSSGLSRVGPVAELRSVGQRGLNRDLHTSDVPVLLPEPCDTDNRRHESERHDSVARSTVRTENCGSSTRAPTLQRR